MSDGHLSWQFVSYECCRCAVALLCNVNDY